VLVLSRKKGESIMVSDNIEFTILEVEGDTVKIGVSAPKDIEIHRKEVYISIQKSNIEASGDREELIKKLAIWKE